MSSLLRNVGRSGSMNPATPPWAMSAPAVGSPTHHDCTATPISPRNPGAAGETSAFSLRMDLSHLLERQRSGLCGSGSASPLDAEPRSGGDSGSFGSGSSPRGDSPTRAPSVTLTDRHGRQWLQSQKRLGSGAFGEVWLGVSADDGELVAVKTLRVPRIHEIQPQNPVSVAQRRRRQRAASSAAPLASAVSPEERQRRVEDLVREVDILTKVSHPNIVNYRASLVSLRDELAIVIMEFVAGGSLADMLSNFGPLPLSSSRRYLRDACSGLACLHSRGIIHRDMKPHNLLLKSSGCVKLADFGAAARLEQLCEGEKIGTPVYMAPEQCRGLGVGPLSDMWSVGIITCELLTHALPWTLGPEPFVAQAFIFRLGKEEDFAPTIPDTLDPGAQLFARRCLQRVAEQRPSAEEARCDAFLSQIDAAGSPRKVLPTIGAGRSLAAAALRGAREERTLVSPSSSDANLSASRALVGERSQSAQLCSSGESAQGARRGSRRLSVQPIVAAVAAAASGLSPRLSGSLSRVPAAEAAAAAGAEPPSPGRRMRAATTTANRSPLHRLSGVLSRAATGQVSTDGGSPPPQRQPDSPPAPPRRPSQGPPPTVHQPGSPPAPPVQVTAGKVCDSAEGMSPPAPAPLAPVPTDYLLTSISVRDLGPPQSALGQFQTGATVPMPAYPPPSVDSGDLLEATRPLGSSSRLASGSALLTQQQQASDVPTLTVSTHMSSAGSLRAGAEGR
eukprot:TRINITY_DN4334_c0_g1_i2.p1 TRINITY_DN4334_c0_g1~~TRINITY_DN4334_c0_g1_i2.p1  ORF type:complete len:785 (+),score=143.75 TRINITY_DN4334_c0_g1_i2:160-2355(+)